MASEFKPGIEIKVVSAGKNTGKTIVFDVESDDFKPWRETFLTHYAEYRDFDTGETYWKKFGRRPNTTQIRYCNNVIRHNEDGTYEYVKNRETGELRQLTEEEAMWLILKAV
jgi:hypothetical protein